MFFLKGFMGKLKELADWRKNLGEDQAGLARKVGETQPNISDYENGRRGLPIKTLKRLRKLGYTGPAKAGEITLTREEVERLLDGRLADLRTWLEKLLGKAGPKDHGDHDLNDPGSLSGS